MFEDSGIILRSHVTDEVIEALVVMGQHEFCYVLQN